MLKQTVISKTNKIKLYIREKSIKLTSWYKGTQTPIYPGVYERKFVGGLLQYAKWTGEYWCISDANPRNASRRAHKSNHQQRPWRGLTK